MKAYLEDAMDYEVEVSGKIAEMNRIQVFLESVEMNLREEECLMAALEDALNRKQKLPLDCVANQLQILISEYVFDAGGRKNKMYLEAIEQLKKMI